MSDSCINSISSILKQMSQIPGFMTEKDWGVPTYELPYDIFIRSFEIFNKNFMPEVLVLRLHIMCVEIMVNITNEFQTITYHRYGELELELSKKKFKVRWASVIAVQEYVNVLSEIVALSLHISELYEFQN